MSSGPSLQMFFSKRTFPLFTISSDSTFGRVGGGGGVYDCGAMMKGRTKRNPEKRESLCNRRDTDRSKSPGTQNRNEKSEAENTGQHIADQAATRHMEKGR